MNTKFTTTLLVALVLLVSACKQNNQQVQFELSTPVSVMVLKPTVIEEYINSTGTVFPVHETTLSTQIDGNYFLQKNPRTGKPFALGDRVNKGEVIIKLEDKEYENSIKIETVKLDWEISQMDYEKQKSLYDKGGVTLSDVKDGEIAYKNAEIEYENAKLSLAKMKVVAPFTGTITELPYFTSGTYVASASEAVTLMDFREMLLYVNLPEKNYSQVKVGQDVYITNYSMPDDTLKGTIEQISPAIDTDARTFKSVVSINNPDQILLPGMFVKADLVISRESNALVIPKEIISTRGNRSSVYIVKDGAAEERRLSLGIANGGDVMVTNGLSSGDRLIIKGYETLQNRSKVKIMNEEVQETEEQQQQDEGTPEGEEGGQEPPQGPPPGGEGGPGPGAGGPGPGGN